MTNDERTVDSGAGLARAVSEIQPGGVIRLAAGRYELPYRLLVNKDLRLIGAGSSITTITGSMGILSFDGDGPINQLGLTGLTLSGARADLDGPALRVQNAIVALNDVVFSDNRIPDGNFAGGGAAAFIRCSHVHLNEVVFLDNAAPQGGALLASQCGDVRVSNGFFHNNSADTGCDIIATHSAKLSLVHCTFGAAGRPIPRVVVEGAPLDGCELNSVGSLFVGSAPPFSVLRPETVTIELSFNGFGPGASEVIADLDVSEEKKRERLEASSDPGVVIDGLAEGTYRQRFVRPNRFEGNTYQAISLLPSLDDRAFAAVPDPAKPLRGRVTATTLALPTHDLLGTPRPIPAMIGCIER